MSALQPRALSAASRALLDGRPPAAAAAAGGEESSGAQAAYEMPKGAELCSHTGEGAKSLEEIRWAAVCNGVDTGASRGSDRSVTSWGLPACRLLCVRTPPLRSATGDRSKSGAGTANPGDAATAGGGGTRHPAHLGAHGPQPGGGAKEDPPSVGRGSVWGGQPRVGLFHSTVCGPAGTAPPGGRGGEAAGGGCHGHDAGAVLAAEAAERDPRAARAAEGPAAERHRAAPDAAARGPAGEGRHGRQEVGERWRRREGVGSTHLCIWEEGAVNAGEQMPCSPESTRCCCSACPCPHSAAESRRQAHRLEELLSQREAESRRLLETEAQVGALQSKSEALELALQEAGAVLSAYEKRRRVAAVTAGVALGPRDVSQASLGTAIETALRDLEAENGGLRTKLQCLEAERRAKEQAERESVEQTDRWAHAWRRPPACTAVQKCACVLLSPSRVPRRVEQLSSSHHQEAAVLREKLRGSEATVSSLQAQLQLVRKQAEARASAVQRHLGDLERSLSALRGPVLEAQHMHLRQGLQEALVRAEALGAEGEELRKKLESKECEVEALEMERRQLGDELQEHKLQVHHLKLSLEQQESRTRCLEQQLGEKMLELEVQRTRVAHLADEQAALRQSFGAQWTELEGTNSRLRVQLKQAKSTLRTLEGADGHGLKVAFYMQKEITAKREQIDALQGRVQLLQESLDKVSQEQKAQGAELQATRQRLSSVNMERRRLATELRALRSLEKRLRDKADALQAALDKMSEKLSECEGRAQQREQEIFRLKIHHTLHLRELEGQKRSTAPPKQAGPVPPCGPAEAEREPCVAFDSSACVGKLLVSTVTQNPDIDLGSLVQEPRGVNEEDGSNREPPPERPRPLGEHSGYCKRSGSFTCTRESQHQESSHHHPVVTSAVSGTCAPLARVSCSSAGPSGPSSSSYVRELHLGRRSPVSSLLLSSPVSTSGVHRLSQ
ncbi:coiled-coil domain-containing protein 158 isoform X3 [Scleropages formosus]|uniref:coiled-coil domain-containing protein 158 isoform X3 n=1 Tax=Scleropages formosus TaxID=113540 RepID=UPI0010FA644A|nr:coiled-coil domain-containing protein 158 isoform X3 [Scleropages formosus]